MIWSGMIVQKNPNKINGYKLISRVITFVKNLFVSFTNFYLISILFVVNNLLRVDIFF